MTSSSPEANVLRWMLKVPLASPREIASFMGMSDSTIYRTIHDLEGEGFMASVSAGCPRIPPARRYWLTPAGVREIGLSDRTPANQLLESFPISREWLHVLLRRLGSVIPIYQDCCRLGVPLAPQFDAIGLARMCGRPRFERPTELRQGRALAAARVEQAGDGHST